jgi:hypothetical protein
MAMTILKTKNSLNTGPYSLLTTKAREGPMFKMVNRKKTYVGLARTIYIWCI